MAGLRHAGEGGGLSGAPLCELSTEVIRKLAQLLEGRIPIIGVGGVMSAADARAKLGAGASLVQIYTGFIYRGCCISCFEITTTHIKPSLSSFYRTGRKV